MSEIRIILESGSESGSIKQTNDELRTMQSLLVQLADNKTALGGAESLANVQKLTAETKKLENQIASLQAKQKTAADKEKKATEEQSGLLGQLIQKKKQLQGSLVGAKSVDEIRKINSALAATNLNIVKLKNTGVSSFNTFEKALASFQFKFNFLGNLIGNTVGSLITGPIGALGTAFSTAGTAVVDSIQNITKNLLGLTEAERLHATAIDGTIILNDQLRDSYNETLKSIADLEIEYRLLTGSITEYEASILRIKNTSKSKIESIRNNTKEDLEKMEGFWRKLGETIITSAGFGQGVLASNILEAQRIVRERDAAISGIEKEAAEKEKVEKARRDKEILAEAKKRNKELLDEREKSLQREYKAFVEFHDKKDAALKDAIKKEKKTQEGFAENAKKLEEDTQKEEEDAFDKNRNEAIAKRKEDEKKEKEANQRKVEEAKKLTDQILSQIDRRNQAELDAINTQIEAQDKSIDTQRALAEKGLDNTLAFEQRRKVELEREAQLQQKRLARLKKIEAYYNLFAQYAKEDPSTAAFKALKDIVISESITAAFAEDGGMGEDIKDRTTLGMTGLSKSHGPGQDMLVVMSKKEGVLTEDEITALGGSKGFYDLKKILNNPSDDGEFVKAEQSFQHVFAPKIASSEDSGLTKAINKLSKKIDGIETVHTGIDGMGNLITRSEVGGIIRNIIKPKRVI